MAALSLAATRDLALAPQPDLLSSAQCDCLRSQRMRHRDVGDGHAAVEHEDPVGLVSPGRRCPGKDVGQFRVQRQRAIVIGEAGTGDRQLTRSGCDPVVGVAQR